MTNQSWNFKVDYDAHKDKIEVIFHNDERGFEMQPSQRFDTVAEAEEFGRKVILFEKKTCKFPNFCQDIDDVVKDIETELNK